MTVPEIASLPVAHVAHPEGAHLWLWVTNNYLEDGLRVMRQWGFRYVTNLCWGKVKLSKKGEPKVQRGLGQYIAGSHELLLFGVRGRLPAAHKQVKGLGAPLSFGFEERMRRVVEEHLLDPDPTQGSSVLLAERTEHSRKPDEVFSRVEIVSPGPRLELFSRAPREGWQGVGHEHGDDARTWLLCMAAHLAAG